MPTNKKYFRRNKTMNRRTKKHKKYAVSKYNNSLFYRYPNNQIYGVEKEENKENTGLKLIVCYKIKIKNDKIYGGAPDDERNLLNKMIFTEMLDYLKTNKNPTPEDNIIKAFIESSQSGESSQLVKDVYDYISGSKKVNKNIELFNAVKSHNSIIDNGGSLNNAGKQLYDNLKLKFQIEKLIKNISEQIDSNKDLSNTQKKKIKKLLTTDGSIFASVGKVTENIGNTLQNAIGFATIIANKNDVKSNKKYNQQKIQLLWYPRQYIHYKKGKSKSKTHEDDDIKYGDFMILIEPEKYANVSEFFNETFSGVDDLLANVLNGCTDIICSKGISYPSPYRIKTLTIKNEQPEFDNPIDNSNPNNKNG